jgi:formylglycine-generating enzyme required for sulfatase activity
MVKAGPVCIDKYEVSVWSSPTGGTQYGTSSDNYPCDNNGQNCTNIYARSVPGVTPSRFITWFQAQQALANSGKRLPTNAEWQLAVAGTPDPGASPGSEDCNTSSAGPETAGQRTNCVSRFGANDMIGNLDEWVGDWDELQTPASCANYSAGTGFTGDRVCIGDDGTSSAGALIRGGHFAAAGGAGALSIQATIAPFNSDPSIGFRGAR